MTRYSHLTMMQQHAFQQLKPGRHLYVALALG